MSVRPSPTQTRALLAAAVLLSLGWFLVKVGWPSARVLTAGFGAYYTASRLLVQGELDGRIYDEAHIRPQVRADMLGEADDIFNANPPTTALLFVPVQALPPHAARTVWTLLNLALLVLGLALLVGATGPPWRERSSAAWQALAPLLVVALLFRPVHASFEQGQAYVTVFCLLALVAFAVARDRSGLAAGALTAALLLKSAGTAVPLALIAARRWRTLLIAAAAGLGLVLITLPLLHLETWLAYRRLLAEVVAAPSLSVTVYQTTRGLLLRLLALDPRWNPRPLFDAAKLVPWLLGSIAIVSLVVTLRVARRDPLAGVAAAVAWGVLLAPLGEQHHHAVMLVPVGWALLAWQAGQLTRGAQVLLTVAVVLYIVPFPIGHPELSSGAKALLAYPRLYGGWLAWAAVVVPLRVP